MDQVKAKKGAWFKTYSGFKKKDDNPANQTPGMSNRQQDGYQPGYCQQQFNQQRQPGPGTSQQGAPKFDGNQPKPRYGPYPAQPKACHQTVLDPDPDDYEEESDYDIVNQ